MQSYHQHSQSSSVAVAKEVLVVLSPLNEYWTNARSVPPNEKREVSFELKRTFVACMLCAGKLINCDFGSTHGYRTTRTPGRERSRENSREKERKDRSAQERTRENNNTTSTNNTTTAHLHTHPPLQSAPDYSNDVLTSTKQRGLHHLAQAIILARAIQLE